MLSQLQLYWNTFKYLKSVQVYGRLYAILKKYLHLYLLPRAPGKLKASLENKTEWLHHDPWNKNEDLIKHRFTFLNQTIKMRDRINWEPEASELWKFNLHYFDYLHLLEKTEQREICLEWINNNPTGKGTGWHPYTVSRRIVNWIKADLNIQEINKSLFTQAAYLYRNLEFFHPNNHYLSNAKALVFAGTYFKENKNAKKWLSKGLNILHSQVPKQVHNDGGYFEPSITYHALVLYDLLDLINIIDEKDVQPFIITAEKMITFLDTMTHPDGDIVLFNDSSVEIAPKTTDLVFYADDLGLNVNISKPGADNTSLINFPDTGFAVVSSDKFYFALDYGGIRPKHIPAHTHPGVFNYELSIEELRFVSDTGTGTYETGNIRTLVRKSFAHNTLTIDNLEQADAWKSFRIGERFEPKNVTIKELSDVISFEGMFDGYSTIIGDQLVFKRDILAGKNSIRIIDEVTGAGNHVIKSFIHLHPQIEAMPDGKDILLSYGPVKVKLNITDGNAELRKSSYYPEFGKSIKNKVVVISGDIIPGKITYRFIF